MKIPTSLWKLMCLLVTQQKTVPTPLFRHLMLLTPTPSFTLVVTRCDVTTALRLSLTVLRYPLTLQGPVPWHTPPNLLPKGPNFAWCTRCVIRLFASEMTLTLRLGEVLIVMTLFCPSGRPPIPRQNVWWAPPKCILMTLAGRPLGHLLSYVALRSPKYLL